MNRTRGEDGATVLVIAGRSIDIDTATAKAHGYPAVTVARYDLPGPGALKEITADEIARTHKVRSRISHAQLDWFIRTAVDAPWAAAPIQAQLVEADPNISGELYDRAEALYDHFRTAAPRRVGVAKISKVLHLKRPGLFPILDSKVRWVRSRWRRRSSWALSASRGDAMAEESTLGSTVNKCAV
ncbi:DUF6308 family protein [Rhodococcus rhodochrous]|uniref:DUF6308 family protein n=1 Tax=Rhodococcus rhodochrous TaxID=1829 RepID=UPI001CE29DC1|nr:DUF6308 family protein [Rhodococcus rhodochrous]